MVLQKKADVKKSQWKFTNNIQCETERKRERERKGASMEDGVGRGSREEEVEKRKENKRKSSVEVPLAKGRAVLSHRPHHRGKGTSTV